MIVIFTAFSTALGRGPRTVRPPAAAHAPPEEQLPDHGLYLIKAGLAAVVLAIFVDSLLYNAFFEDPYLWTALRSSRPPPAGSRAGTFGPLQSLPGRNA